MDAHQSFHPSSRRSLPLVKPTWSSALPSLLPSFLPGTSHPRFWRWLTVTTLAKRPSVNVLSRSLFPAGQTSAARAQLQFTDPLLRSYLLSENLCLLLFSAAANFSSFPLISSFLIFFCYLLSFPSTIMVANVSHSFRLIYVSAHFITLIKFWR